MQNAPRDAGYVLTDGFCQRMARGTRPADAVACCGTARCVGLELRHGDRSRWMRALYVKNGTSVVPVALLLKFQGDIGKRGN